MYSRLYFLFFFNPATSIQLFYFSKHPQILDQKADSIIFNDGLENSEIKLKSLTENDEGSKNPMKNPKYSISAKCEMLASKGIRDLKCEALRQGPPLYYFQQTVRPKPKPVFTNFMPLSLNNLQHQYEFVDLTRDDFSMDYIDDVFRTGQISEREKRQALECKLLSLLDKAPEECAHRRSRGRRELLNVDNDIDPETDLKSHTRFKVIDGKHSKDYFRGNDNLKNKGKKVTTEATNQSSQSDDTESEQSQKDTENVSKSDSSISEEYSKTSRPDNDMDLLQNDWETATKKPVKPKKTFSEENIQKSTKKPEKYLTVTTNPDESESEEPEVEKKYVSKEAEVPKKYVSKESEVPKKYVSKESEVPKKYASKESVVPKKNGSKKTVVPKKNGPKKSEVPKKNGSKKTEVPKKDGSKEYKEPKTKGTQATEAPKNNWSRETAIPKNYWSFENSAGEKPASGSTEVKNQLTDLDWSTSVEQFKEKYTYLQGHTYLQDSRKRLNQFLPKRTYWDDRQIRHLTNFWFNTAPYE